RQPRQVVQVPPPRQDPRRVALQATTQRHPALDLTTRTHLHRRPARHRGTRL
ncbi:MAG: hypothetical protein AVDCRST_MAG47-1874, partial [uncultured Nocardioidaceae bacterium]